MPDFEYAIGFVLGELESDLLTIKITNDLAGQVNILNKRFTHEKIATGYALAILDYNLPWGQFAFKDGYLIICTVHKDNQIQAHSFLVRDESLPTFERIAKTDV